MKTYSLTHLSDHVLLGNAEAAVSQERNSTAWALAHIAEIDSRRLYLPAGYPSMRAYCVEKLAYSEDAASKQVQAARAALQFPAIFDALAEARLHLTGLGLLVPHLTPENVNELLDAAAHKTKFEIKQLLAERFPGTELMPLVEAVPSSARPNVTATSVTHAPAHVEAVPPREEPLSPESYAMHFTISRGTHEKLEYFRALMSHGLPSGDIAEVLDRALDLSIEQLEKRRFAATKRPRVRARRTSANPRHIPAHVKRAVWQRDQGRCTFVGEEGHRCRSRRFLQFDHVDPVARGGEASVAGLRLRCRGHNQLEAERVFGAEFMRHKREEARRRPGEEREKAAKQSEERDGVPWLRALGIRADEARRLAAHCDAMTDAPLEERVRRALSFLGPRGVRREDYAVRDQARCSALESPYALNSVPQSVARMSRTRGLPFTGYQ